MTHNKISVSILAFMVAAASQAAWIDWGTVTFDSPTATSGRGLIDFNAFWGHPDLFNDLGQYYLDINTEGGLEAYDYDGTTGVNQGGNYTWLLNNIQGGDVKNSHIVGTGFEYVGQTMILKSDGFWNWYNPAFGSTDLHTWGLTGNYRLSLPDVVATADGPTTFNLQAEAVPEPVTMGLAALGLGMALKRRRK